MTHRVPPPGNRRPAESAAWHASYASEAAIARRRNEIGRKLTLLGVSSEAVDNTVLDACCGHGETLSALHELGFRKLHGVDLSVAETLRADTRFQVQAGDVTRLPFVDSSFDWIFCVHSLHHLASAENVKKFIDEAHRLLRPGGKLSIVDFPGSLQIKLAFWFFRQNALLVTPYLKWFGGIVQEEWFFLKDYLPQWPDVHRALSDRRFDVESSENRFFYFYLTLRKMPDGRLRADSGS